MGDVGAGARDDPPAAVAGGRAEHLGHDVEVGAAAGTDDRCLWAERGDRVAGDYQGPEELGGRDRIGEHALEAGHPGHRGAGDVGDCRGHLVGVVDAAASGPTAV